MVLRADNPYLAGYDPTGVTRRGYVQFSPAQISIVSDTGGVAVQTGGNTRMTITASGDAVFTSNVTVSGALGVTGGATFNAGLTIPDNVNAAITLGQFSAGNPNSIFSFGGSALLFQYAGVPRLNIANNGNVTIGGTLTVSGASATIGGVAVATQTYVNTAIANLVASSPATLDTLNELAIALGNDPNFATTMTNALAGKAALAGATFSGTVNFGNDVNFWLAKLGGNPTLAFDNGDYIQYDRATNKLYFYGAGVAMASINLSNGNILTKGTIGASQAAV